MPRFAPLEPLDEYNRQLEAKLAEVEELTARTIEQERRAASEEAERRLLEADPNLTAVVCANDEMAAGAFGVARERNLAIPDKISIMGYDNVFFSRYFRPQLSTVNNPIREMGRMAARWILKEIYGQEDLELQLHFEPEVVERGSVAVLNPD